MKKLILLMALAITGCSHPDPKNSAVSSKKEGTAKCKYICIMDKDICSAKPGVCPKCGMQLVEKEDDK